MDPLIGVALLPAALLCSSGVSGRKKKPNRDKPKATAAPGSRAGQAPQAEGSKETAACVILPGTRARARFQEGTPMRIASYIATTILLLAGSAATAQTAGSTSGPAAGTAVVPNTAVQKENPSNAAPGGAKEGVSPGAAVSAGSPGATAKEGTQGGPAPASAASAPSNQPTGGVSPGGAIGAGAPGSTARQGTQGGPAPNPPPSK